MTKDEQIAQLRKIIENTIWMAKRYANGRKSYAPELVNTCIDRAMLLDVELDFHDEPLYAEDGMFGKWDPNTQTFSKE